MRKQIIRLTESDLHRIIKESVRRILREEDEPEYTQADLDAAKAKMQALRGKGNHKAFMAAANEYQKIKAALGQENVIDLRKMSPEDQMGWAEKENQRRGVDPEQRGSHIWNKRLYGINTQKQLHQDIDAEKGPKINSELGI